MRTKPSAVRSCWQQHQTSVEPRSTTQPVICKHSHQIKESHKKKQSNSFHATSAFSHEERNVLFEPFFFFFDGGVKTRRVRATDAQPLAWACHYLGTKLASLPWHKWIVLGIWCCYWCRGVQQTDRGLSKQLVTITNSGRGTIKAIIYLNRFQVFTPLPAHTPSWDLNVCVVVWRLVWCGVAPKELHNHQGSPRWSVSVSQHIRREQKTQILTWWMGFS